MLLSKYGLIYLHAPKTAGNAIQSMLIDLSDDNKVTNDHQDGLDRFEIVGRNTRKKHATLSEYFESMAGIPKEYRICLSIRHPFDRALSYYFSPHRWFRREKNGLVSRVANKVTGYTLPNKPIAIEPRWNASSFEECMYSMTTLVEFLLLKNEIQVPDYLIRYENLQADFNYLVSAVELPLTETKLITRNTSADESGLRRELKKDKGLRQMVADHFSDDMSLFGYD